jgi:hypothetical protein
MRGISSLALDSRFRGNDGGKSCAHFPHAIPLPDKARGEKAGNALDFSDPDSDS